MARQQDWTVGCKKTKHPGIFQTKDGFRVRVRAVDPRTGKLRGGNRLVQGTIRDALAAQESMRAEIQAGTVAAERKRIGEYAQSWMRLKVTTVDPNTASRYADALDGHVLPAFGDFYIDALTRPDVQAWVTGHIARDYAIETVKGWFRVFHTLIRDAVDMLGLQQDPTARIVFPAPNEDNEDEGNSANTLNAEELSKFLAAIKKKRLGQYALVSVLAMTGLRFCHASALRWEDSNRSGVALHG
jgi:integrase